MLHNKLPKSVNPRKLCHQGGVEGILIQGIVELPELADLGEKCELDVKLVFRLDESGACHISIQGRARFKTNCQRCLGAFEYTTDIYSQLSPVASDAEAKLLAKNYEPLLAPSDEVVVSEWLHEEVLLSLPLMPTHDDISCNEFLNRVNSFESCSNELKLKTDDKKVSPFAQIKAQLER